MKRFAFLVMCVCMTCAADAQFLIDKTGYYGPQANSRRSGGGGFLQGFIQGLTQGVQGNTTRTTTTPSNDWKYSLNINSTGFVGDPSFGQYYDLGNGAWFKGVVKNNRRSAGTMHYSDGSEEIGLWDENDKANGCMLVKWPNGTWWYGDVVHGTQDGKASSYIEGKYYNQVWEDGVMVSSEETTKPWYDKATHDKTVRQLHETPVDDSGSSSSSSSSYSSSRTDRTCPRCLGKGTCSNCNGAGYYRPGLGNAIKCRCTNGKCTLCNGTGKYGHLNY